MSIHALTSSFSALRMAARLPRLAPQPVAGPSRSYSSQRSIGLNSLSPAPGSKSYRTRRGRGHSSTHGGHTSGRGDKGAGSRTGKSNPYIGFAGGQEPLYKTVPKRGFYRSTKRLFQPVNITRLQMWIQQGRIDPSKPIDIRTVVKSRLVRGMSRREGVILLGKPNPQLPFPPLEVRLSKFSEAAADHVIKAGGSCTAVFHNRVTLRQELRPDLFPHIPPDVRMIAKPSRQKEILYYSDPKKHGFLHKLEPDRQAMFKKFYGFDPNAPRPEKRVKRATTWTAPVIEPPPLDSSVA